MKTVISLLELRLLCVDYNQILRNYKDQVLIVVCTLLEKPRLRFSGKIGFKFLRFMRFLNDNIDRHEGRGPRTTAD